MIFTFRIHVKRKREDTNTDIYLYNLENFQSTGKKPSHIIKSLHNRESVLFVL